MDDRIEQVVVAMNFGLRDLEYEQGRGDRDHAVAQRFETLRRDDRSNLKGDRLP
jgi:hypothetical protein